MTSETAQIILPGMKNMRKDTCKYAENAIIRNLGLQLVVPNNKVRSVLFHMEHWKMHHRDRSRLNPERDLSAGCLARWFQSIDENNTLLSNSIGN